MRRERVRTSLRDGVLDIALLDAIMSSGQSAELTDVLSEHAEDRDVRAVLLRSESEDFCVGVDDVRIVKRIHGPTPADALAAIRVPVIAVLTGRVESVGLELALAADVRLSASDAFFRLSEVSEGRLPSWGGTQRLPRVIGQAAALRMILFGERMEAMEALHQGLVHEVVAAPLERAAEYTSMWKARAPLALEYAKEAVRDGAELRLREGLALEADLNTLLQTSRDRAEGIAAFLAKRTANFRNA